MQLDNSLGSLQPTSTNDFDMPGLEARSNMDPLNQNATKQNNYKNYRNIYITCIFSFDIAAQVTFET
jgi:hypothetical protein